MKCIAVCQGDLVARTLHQALAPTLDIEFFVEDRTLSRRLNNDGIPTKVGDTRRVDTFTKANITATTCIIIEDSGRKSVRQIIEAASDAGASSIYVLEVGDIKSKRTDDWAIAFPGVSSLSLANLAEAPLLGALNRSLTRARVQQYQHHFNNADRILILLHNDPDPDALASGLALRNLLHRTKTTAIIGAFHGVTRPENQRMANLLDIRVEQIGPESLSRFDRIATVDVQPHYFGGLLNRVDLVIDHHPDRSGRNAIFKDIRPDYGSTATILTDHFRAVNTNVSERIATAMLYAIKSDTLFLSRQTNRSDLDAFTFLYPLADPKLIRQVEGSGITLERLQHVTQAIQACQTHDQVFAAHLGAVPREDIVPYVADFLLQLEDVKWTIVSGQVNDDLVVSVRNVGYSRNAGEFVNLWFNEIGSAGGHRAMAKAVVPIKEFQSKFGQLGDEALTRLLHDLALRFLREPHGRHSRTASKQKLSSARVKSEALIRTKGSSS